MVLNEHSDINTEDCLLFCIQQGNNEEAQTILQDLNPSDVIDGFGNTLLHFTSECGNSIMTKYLIDRECEIDAENDYGNTPLILAAQKNHKDIILMFIEENAKVLIPNDQGKSAAKFVLSEMEIDYDILYKFVNKLKEECLNDSLETAKELLKVKCPLPRAMALKDNVITEYMLNNGCRVNDPDDGFFGNTPLHEAVRNSDLENIALLIAYGADVNAEDLCGSRPLRFATDQRVIETLVNYGAQLVTDDGRLVTGHIFQNGSRELIEMFLQPNLDFSAYDYMTGSSLLHYLLGNQKFNPIEIIKTYIDDQFDVNQSNFSGETALTYASMASNPDAVEFFLQKGAEVNAVNKYENTALTSSFMVTSLLPMSEAAKEAQTKVLMLLLEHGADVQFVGSNQRTILYYVSSYTALDWTKTIIAHVALIEELGCTIKDLILTDINSHLMFKNYYKFCKAEIEKMKNTVVWEHVSLFKLLTINEDEIADFSNNNQLISKVQSIMYEKHRPKLYYNKILRKNLMKLSNKQLDYSHV